MTRTALIACSFFWVSVLFGAACAGTGGSTSPDRASAVASTARTEASRPASGTALPEPIRLTLVVTADPHGAVLPHVDRMDDGSVWRYGGAALFARHLEKLRAQNPGGVVLVDAGDLFQGPLAANLCEGASLVAAYNALGYDAVALGNHDFDYGPIGPKNMPREPGDDPVGALTARTREARFPFLARNVTLADGVTAPPFLDADGLAMVERKGLRIGLVGVVTPKTPDVTNPANVSGLRFSPMAPAALAGAAELRQRGADLVVALVHAGGKCSELKDPNDLSSCDRRQEIFQFLDAVPHGAFDAVVAGHTHQLVGHFYRGMAVIEPRPALVAFGTVDFFVDPATRRPLADRTLLRAHQPLCEQVFVHSGDCDPKKWKPGAPVEPALLDGVPVRPDPAIEALLAPFDEPAQRELTRPLGVKLPKPLTRLYSGESTLGNAITDALRAMEKADFAMLNGGSLRADLPSGPLTYGYFYDVLPFDNEVSTLTVTGEELHRIVEASLAGGHAAPQISGYRLEAIRCGTRARLERLVTSKGRPIDPKRSYKFVTTSFLLQGGNGLAPVFDAIPGDRKDFGHRRDKNLREALVAWLSARGGAWSAEVERRLVLREGRPDECADGAGR